MATTIVSSQSLRKALTETAAPALEFAAVPEVEASEVEVMAHFAHALQVLEAEGSPPDVMCAPRDQIASLMQTFLARKSEEAGQTAPLEPGGIEATFDSQDLLGWAGSFFRWWKKICPHPFINWDGQSDRIGNKARIALLSDWGSNLYGAPKCADSITRDPAGFDVVLHLGDVYYAGDHDEIRERLLAPWPRVQGAINRTLNGNHEMYTGGKGYFELALNQFSQQSSFCVIENDFWILVGLDTAYDDHGLHGAQVDWIQGLVEQADGRKIALFSHHQPYSILNVLRQKSPGKERNLVTKLGRFLHQKQISAWYWGHEHHCILYHRHPLWGLHGRCVGHSGFPEFRPSVPGLEQMPPEPVFRPLPASGLVPGGLVLDGPNQHIAGHEEQYVPHGYVVLELDEHRLNEVYREADGTLLLEREIQC